jgi:cyclophilin family peptidyl-prolyl cis-trans isomerase
MPTALLLLAALAAATGATPPANPQVVFKTNLGEFTLELYPDKAPATVENFLAYVKAGHYDGTIFHRVMPGFMAQGGGYDADLKGKPTKPPVKNEADNGLKNLRGTAAMARTNDPNSATAQFFVNLVDNSFLDHREKTLQGWGYCVFGKVVAGMDVVDAMAKVKTGAKGMMQSDVPLETITIQSAQVK